MLIFFKTVNFSCNKAIILFSNKTIFIQELDFDQSVCMAADIANGIVVHYRPFWQMSSFLKRNGFVQNFSLISHSKTDGLACVYTDRWLYQSISEISSLPHLWCKFSLITEMRRYCRKFLYLLIKNWWKYWYLLYYENLIYCKNFNRWQLFKKIVKFCKHFKFTFILSLLINLTILLKKK